MHRGMDPSKCEALCEWQEGRGFLSPSHDGTLQECRDSNRGKRAVHTPKKELNRRFYLH
ncbi:hypothetical protein Gohar_013677, partial [Gossypium harknessii]|nr:hypothetical protein [Gossypium harknessii]